MFTGIFEPAFLQAASQHKKEEPILVPHLLVHINKSINKTFYISGTDLEVWTKHNGEKQVYSFAGASEYREATIQADADTDIIILGGLTEIQITNAYNNAITIFDASNAPNTFVNIEQAECDMDNLEIVKVSSYFTAVASLWSDTKKTMLLQYPANDQWVTKYFKDNLEIVAATAEGGTLYTDLNGTYAAGLIAAAQSRNWTVLPIPAE